MSVIYHFVTNTTITTSGGSGSVSLNFNGKIDQVGVYSVPVAGVGYDIDLTDGVMGIFGKTGLVGLNTIDVGHLCTGTLTINISNATVNGVFGIRVYVETGGPG